MPPYRKVKQLGQGGFGVVFHEVDEATGRDVAIKYLNSPSPDARERFGREVRHLYSQIDNRYVVDLLAYDLEAATPYLVLEYCEGGSLRSWVTNRRPWRDVAVALSHVVQGLAGIHRVGGFHRDIKPDNMLQAVDRARNEYLIKLADFGLARTPVSTTGPMTRSPAGTDGYIAAEVLAGAPFSQAADIYSLGISAVELLVGVRDISMLATTAVPAALRQLVLSMVSLQPVQRPTTSQAAGILAELFRSPQPTAAAAPSQASPAAANTGAGALLGGLLVGGALIAGLAALFGGDKKGWDDSVGRHRDDKGRFTKG